MLDSSNNKIKKTRCYQCNKKVGINYYECKCDKMYCENHRFPFEHQCEYDWKKNKLNELNSILMAGKTLKRKIEMI